MAGSFWTNFALMMFGLAAAIALLLWFVSKTMIGDGTPDAAQRDFLTSSAADETIVSWHVCNALVHDAQASFFTNVLDAARHARHVTGTAHVPGAGAGQITLDAMKAFSGGLWVGGTVYLTSHRIVFLPNSLNRAFLDKPVAIETALTELKSVYGEKGWLQNHAWITAHAGTIKLRFRAASEFVTEVKSRA